MTKVANKPKIPYRFNSSTLLILKVLAYSIKMIIRLIKCVLEDRNTSYKNYSYNPIIQIV